MGSVVEKAIKKFRKENVHMKKQQSDNLLKEIYNKGYEDGVADAINNLEFEDILNQIPELSQKEKQEIVDIINKENSEEQ